MSTTTFNIGRLAAILDVLDQEAFAERAGSYVNVMHHTQVLIEDLLTNPTDYLAGITAPGRSLTYAAEIDDAAVPFATIPARIETTDADYDHGYTYERRRIAQLHNNTDVPYGVYELHANGVREVHNPAAYRDQFRHYDYATDRWTDPALATCADCGRTWDAGLNPTSSSRCAFEHDHRPDKLDFDELETFLQLEQQANEALDELIASQVRGDSASIINFRLDWYARCEAERDEYARIPEGAH